MRTRRNAQIMAKNLKKDPYFSALFDALHQKLLGCEDAPGDTGPQGPPGIDGERGPQGIPGRDGKNGINGKDGVDGLRGPRGFDGKDGSDGKQGEQGNVTGMMKLASWTSWGVRSLDNQQLRVIVNFTLNFREDEFVVLDGEGFKILESGYYDISFNGISVEDFTGKGYAEAGIYINDVENFSSTFGFLGQHEERKTGFSIHSGVLKLFGGDMIKLSLQSLSPYPNKLKNLKVTFKKIKPHFDDDRFDHNGEMNPSY